MAEWEYLLQKEGDRSWLPLKPPRMEIPEGRYRVVAHSTRTNTDVEIRITHYCTNEVPPKRRSQRRSHRINAEGLMVVIPFTYVKPGIWDLLVKNDIMSDLLGDIWQQGIQLRVLPKVTETHNRAALDAKATEVLGADSVGNTSVNASPTSIETPVLSFIATDQAETSVPPEVLVALEPESNGAVSTGDESSVKSDELKTSSFPQHSTRRTDAEVLPLQHSPNPLYSDEAESDITAHSEAVVSVNDRLADSQQIAEQIFQQLVDRVPQESESIPAEEYGQQETSWLSTRHNQEPQREDVSLLPALANANQLVLLLTLDQETLVARRGQSLTMTGRVDVPDITLGSNEIESNLNSVFKGTLRYQLRDPQSSQVLMSEQLPLPEKVPPFAFTFSFELPPNCEIRLLLGEVALCDAHGIPIATQPFSLTADLPELLGTILQTSQAVPSAQIPVLTDTQPLESQSELPSETSLDQNEKPASLDFSFDHLIQKAKKPQSFKPSPGQLLPPQITRSSKKPSKTPQLPKLPSRRFSGQPVTTQNSQPAQAMLLEGTSELVDATLSESLQPSASILPSENTFGLQPSEDLSLTKSDSQIQEADVASSSLPPSPHEFPGQEPAVGSLSQTQKAQVIGLKKDTALGIVVDLRLEPTVKEATNTQEAASLNITVPATGAAMGQQGSQNPKILEEPLQPDLEIQQQSQKEVTKPSLHPQGDGESSIPGSLLMVHDDESSTMNHQQGSEGDSLLERWGEEQVISPLSAPPHQRGDVAPLLPSVELVTDSVEQAFQSLRMQERFWCRLNAMAADTELSAWIGNEHSFNNLGEVDLAIDEDAPPSETESVMVDRDIWQMWEPDPEQPDLSFPNAEVQESLPSIEPLSKGALYLETADATKPDLAPNSLSLETQNQLHPSLGNAGFDWDTQEIVVDDELEPAQPARHNSTVEVDDLSALEALSQMLEDVQVPMPELNVPSGELTSGDLLTLWVKLPPYQNPIYVKLWIQDLQSRSLLDGPFFLRDFSPSNTGELETIAQLSVPFGSLSIRFEAVAVDTYAQQESHKVKVDRTVVPPDIPTISLDEFED